MKKSLLNRINKALSEVSQEDITNGSGFYQRHHREIKAGASELDVDVDLYAKTVSILSPYNTWENNIADAHRLLFALKYEPEQLDRLTFTTFRANVDKAIAVFRGEKELTGGQTAMKTFGFYRNLMLDPEHVTIDRHMLKLVDLEKDYGIKSLTARAYHDIADHFRFVAKKHGIKPFELQAILWFHLRDK